MEILDNNGNPIPQQESKRILAGIMGILFGYFAIHKFILGYTKEGIIQIVANICTFGLATIIPFIEGIIYLSKSDQEFIATYQNNHKGWF